ncbi:MAG: class I SAM-dependent methyltransferase [bacterium]|nr:class I SAM-dependent methyltransferase [bacterium]
MTVFNNYARYYNLLYKEKDYSGEVGYIIDLLNQYSKKDVRSMLDVGCGTGNHALLFAEKGYDVFGIDLSQEMISIAESRSGSLDNLNFACCNADDFNLDRQFDAIVSLFHVISYQATNKALYNTFKNVYNHLGKDGIFIFDFWYGPAVLLDRPETRVKRLENDEIKVTRIAESDIHDTDNIVDVNYEVIIEDKASGGIETVLETHKMRYLFCPELLFMLENIGFEVLGALEWMSMVTPCNSNDWNAVFVVKKAQ